MKKSSIFGKLLAIAMVFAGFSLTSCDEIDNPSTGKIWVKPEVTLTEGGATITASTPADISRMLNRIKQEMISAAKKGEKFTIDIEGPALDVSGSDNTIGILTPTGGDLVVNFKSTITADTPLTLESSGVADDAVSTASTNKVEINVPSASGIDLQINMPTTTVTLNAASGSLNIDELITKTAIKTLNIGKGITVNWLKVDGGRAVVEDGAKVLGFIRNGDESEENNSDAYAGKDGIEPIYKELGLDENENPFWGLDVVYPLEESKPDKPYYVQNLKIVKGKAAKAKVFIRNADAKDALESIIIADGAAAAIGIYDGYWDSEKSENVDAPAKGVKLIEGLGNKTAKIYPYDIDPNWQDEDNNPVNRSNMNFNHVKELKNIVADATICPEYYDGNTDEYKDYTCGIGEIYGIPNSTDCDFISPSRIYGNVENGVMPTLTNCTLTSLPGSGEYYKNNEYYWDSSEIANINAINSKMTADGINAMSPNCEGSTFKGNNISFTNYYVSGNTATVKNCKFETSEKEANASIIFPYQTKDRSSFNFGFDTCEFGKGFKFYIDYEGEEPWLDKDGKPITKGYYWYELEDDGVTIKHYFEHQSASEDDIPAANKANGKTDGNGYWDNEEQTWVSSNGYWVREEKSGLRLQTFYKDYKGYLTLTNTTLDGKAITNKTDMIGVVEQGKDEKGEQATKTYYVIDGTTYEAVYSTNDKKWILVATE